MAKKVNNISYKGINHSPSLVSDNDGHASECANLSPDFNDLKPMPMPMIGNNTYQVTPFHKLIFVHRGVGYENYISISDDHMHIMLQDVNSNSLYYMYNSPDFPYWTNDSEILAIEAVGNTLVVSTKSGTEYIVYQPDVPMPDQDDGGSYKPIGQKPPMPVIGFHTEKWEDFKTDTPVLYTVDEEDENEPEVSGLRMIGNADELPYEYDVSYTTRHIMTDDRQMTDRNTQRVADNVNAKVAAVTSHMVKNGLFMYPFFVRYALRLKDGNYIMHSQPFLMAPSTSRSQLLFLMEYYVHPNKKYLNGWIDIATDDKWHYVNPVVYGLGFKLFGNLKTLMKSDGSIASSQDMLDWEEIVESVDIFVSAPLCETKQLDKDDIKNRYDWVGALDLGCSRYNDGIDINNTYYNYLWGQSWPINHPAGDTNYLYGQELPYDNLDRQRENIMSNVLFYKIKSLSIREVLESDQNTISFFGDKVNDLANLQTLPTLPDDYLSNSLVQPKLMQTYNDRLNLANLSLRAFQGYSMYSYDYDTATTISIKKLCFHIKKNGREIVVARNDFSGGGKIINDLYLFYPDSDCFKCDVCFEKNSTNYYISLDMKETMLNGKAWINWDNEDESSCYNRLIDYVNYMATAHLNECTQGTPDISNNLWYDIPNRFMMSATGNPWYFPLQETFDIGLREIRALAINAEQMTAPQYGQNPIYVFSTDGIWTIGINKDGTHNGISYVSGDVISEMQGLGVYPTASAPQIVFFKTARGIMAVTGSTTKEIDKVMMGRVFNPRVKLLPSGSIIDGIPTSGINSYMLDLIFGVCDDMPYADFAAASSLLYDYRNNRLLLYNKDKDYLYVYDVAADFWSKMLPMVVDESDQSPAMQEFNTRGRSTSYTTFNGLAMAGSDAILTDEEGYLWYVGGQPDENDINATQFGLYVSRPMRFGSDDYKTLSRIVHDFQLGNSSEFAKMGLWGSRDGQNYYQITTLRGTSYKFFIIALYTRMLPSSRYAYTAFEWEPRMQDKIR